MGSNRHIGFVPPRYGDEVIGGAETLLREAAHGLAERGWEVEILTTCARDHFSWENEIPAGVEEDGKLLVRRFPTVLDTPRVARREIEAEILAGHRVDLLRQQIWMNDDLRVPDLYHHLLREAETFRALVFAPYLFWTTFACGQIAPERTILQPCLHDEPQAHLELFRPLFTGARGLWFNSDPERELASRIFGPLQSHAVVGAGMHVPAAYDPDGFRDRFGVRGPFVLYAGRREGGKRWEWLLEALAKATLAYDLPFSLVTIGTGKVRAPEVIADRVIDLGFLSEADRNDAFAAAAAYVQPSNLESFSRTIMEAWLAGTPVIGSADSEVVTWHCERSGAGLTFADDEELAQCLRFVAEEPQAAAGLASPGRDYVLEHYEWDKILDALETTLDDWLPSS